MNNTRIKSLDSLRGISSLIVVVFHCMISYQIFYSLNYFNENQNGALNLMNITPIHTLWAGNEAVLLFFILSGFVLALPFLNNKYTGYREFAIKRFFRIYIPYIILMMASVILVMAFAGQVHPEGLSTAYEKRWVDDVTILSLISYVFMVGYDTTNVNGVVWSLNHEMRISLIFPFLMMLLLKFEWKKSLMYVLIVNSVIVSLLSLFATSIPIPMVSLLIENFRDTFYYATFFIFGIVLAMNRNVVVGAFVDLSLYKKIGLFLASLLLINYKWMYGFVDFNDTFVGDILAGLGITLLIAIVLSSNFTERILSTRPFQFLGEVSYSLYMIHMPVLMLSTIFLSSVMPLWLCFVLVPSISIPLAWLSYKYLELPSIAWGRKVISWKRNRVVKTAVKTRLDIR